MKIQKKDVENILNKDLSFFNLEKMTKKELLIILKAVVNEHYNLGIKSDLKTIVKLNKNCIIEE